MTKKIYVDYAASAPLSLAAKEAVIAGLDIVGNASSVHNSGRAARKVVEQARESLAYHLGCFPSEVIFTSGGTEANNLALKGLYWQQQAQDCKRKRIIVSAIEHHAILDVAQWLQIHEGAQVTLITPNDSGIISDASLIEAIGDDAQEMAVISVMLANNEVGSINQIEKLADIAHEAGAFFHSDAIAAVGHCPVNFHDLGVSTLSLSAHKFGGPQGVGALIVKRDVKPEALIHGGGQERDIRSGTYDVPHILGMAAGLEEALADFTKKETYIWNIRSQLINIIEENISGVYFHGAAQRKTDPLSIYQLPGIVNFRVSGCEGDALLMLLDAQSIECSHGAACNAGVSSASHVLMALGVSEVQARGALRLSFNETLTSEDVNYIGHVLPGIVSRARLAGTST